MSPGSSSPLIHLKDGEELVAAYLSLPWLGARTTAPLLSIGVGWLILTVVFEFSFGLLRGKGLAEIMAAYTFKGGKLWPLVLPVTAMAPWLPGSGVGSNPVGA